jgi:20S proteasome alpha/beta subunit
LKHKYQDVAAILKERADLDLTDKQARDFVREALTNTLRIVKKSKGKIQVKNCDVQQFYKKLPWEEIKATKFDLDETKDIKEKTLRFY